MRFNLRILLVIITFAGIAVASFIDPRITELLGISVIALVAYKTIAAISLRGKQRLAALGGAVFGWTYLIVSQLFGAGKPVYLMFSIGQGMSRQLHEELGIWLATAFMVLLGTGFGIMLSKCQDDSG